jgi:hypothetical protein
MPCASQMINVEETHTFVLTNLVDRKRELIQEILHIAKLLGIPKIKENANKLDITTPTQPEIIDKDELRA